MMPVTPARPDVLSFPGRSAEGERYNSPVAVRIAIIEDEKDIVELVRYNLRKEGLEVVGFGRGREGLDYIRRNPVDLVLLDVLLPDLDGFEICRALRADDRSRTLPVIFLTAKGAEVDRVVGLEIGADDYVVKPFSPRELVARVKAVLRRKAAPSEAAEVAEGGEVRLDASTREVVVRGRTVDLSALEFKLLHFLVSHPRRIFSRDRLLDGVWGRDRFVTPRTVDVHIRRLRAKIEADPENPRYLQTVRGSGYRFLPQPEAGEV
ncbi:MAG TPA: winged helix-turn-helix domain-containing protein [Terriglobia bacterium]|nr:winged helix-turn-helix domain-containing protein [Terriglobia bacterium]